MGEDHTAAIPTGFKRHFRRSPLTDPWEPLFSRRGDRTLSIGFRAASNHTNSRGFVHGGLLTALADNAMGLSCVSELGDGPVPVTVSLSVDFIAAAHVDEWVQIDASVLKAGSSICFTQALLRSNDRLCARASGTFRVPTRNPGAPHLP